ncbi:Phytochelatin synthase [Dichotomocladium elegans]|nr:Phytochelatin synthase [Dichotomocladium elegans]
MFGEPLVNFTSVEGKRLFRGAMDQGNTESFFKLMGNFSSQSSPTLGGLSSLAMVLNALEIDPQQRWKGNWRWYSDELLHTCSSKEEVSRRGMSFDEFHCLAQSHCDVDSRRATLTTYRDFVHDLQAVTASGSNQIMVVNYSRSRLGQRGQQNGHFSPIGGYNSVENRALIMDVARGQYPSVWVDAKLLYEAMFEKEQDILGKSRGYFVLRAPTHLQQRTTTTRSTACLKCSRQCLKSLSATRTEVSQII